MCLRTCFSTSAVQDDTVHMLFVRRCLRLRPVVDMRPVSLSYACDEIRRDDNAHTTDNAVVCHVLCICIRHRHFRRRHYVLSCPVVPFVGSSGQILLPRYLKNVLNSFDKSNREYLLLPTDDLVRFRRSKVKD